VWTFPGVDISSVDTNSVDIYSVDISSVDISRCGHVQCGHFQVWTCTVWTFPGVDMYRCVFACSGLRGRAWVPTLDSVIVGV